MILGFVLLVVFALFFFSWLIILLLFAASAVITTTCSTIKLKMMKAYLFTNHHLKRKISLNETFQWIYSGVQRERSVSAILADQ